MSNKIKGAKRIFPLFETKGERRHKSLIIQAKSFTSRYGESPKHLGSKSDRKLQLFR